MLEIRTKTQAKEALDKVDKLFGRGRHNSPSNICWNDGIYGNSLLREYGLAPEEIEKRAKKVLRPRKPK